MLIAEELDCDWDKIRVEHAPPGRQAYLHTTYGQQMTGGSTTTWSEFDRYRQAGATARMMLVEAAANKFKVPASECRTEKGFVVAGSKRASFGELAQAASKLTPPATVPLKDKNEWQYIGKPTKRLDGKAKITGEAIFGMDVHFPGMLIAMVAHAPVFGATVKSVDASAAKGIAGV
jgi:isoquinoline 1-oxidoreductase beta subunit